MQELPIFQKAYDLIRWYVPILNRLPRGQKFVLGDRITTGLYDLLEGLILARFAEKKLAGDFIRKSSERGRPGRRERRTVAARFCIK